MKPIRYAVFFVLLVATVAVLAVGPRGEEKLPAERREIVFWHFWGGADRDVVENIVERFNRHPQRERDGHFVRAIAMPGANLDLKLFLAVTGGDPPDLINQDDPIIADWAHRGALVPLDDLASPQEIEQLQSWLFPAARRLGAYEGRLYGLCNGLDIRALYYNKTLLDAHGLAPPSTIEQLDNIAERLTVFDDDRRLVRVGYLPDSRRLMAWGIVFGGEFYDAERRRVTADSEPIVAALEWMQSYSLRYGRANVAAYRVGDQSLPGKTFPLLAERYAVVMDGQWRVRDIAAVQDLQSEQGRPVTEFGVCPLPPPAGGRENAGWVNGNFFVVPRRAKNAAGAWEFMKFWSGFGGNEAEAAKTCAAGGWIPPSQQVVEQPEFQMYFAERPLFRTFVELAGSPHQLPTPVIPGAPYLQNQIAETAEACMYRETAAPRRLLEDATRRIQTQLDSLNDPAHVAN